MNIYRVFHIYRYTQNINTVSQKKGSSSGDQFQIFQIFCYGVMGRDGLTTLQPKKGSAEPIGWPAWAALGAKIGKNRQIEVEKNPIKVSIFDLF